MAAVFGILGIDVSHWASTIDWTRVRRAGIHFAFLKATEGTRTLDPQFEANASHCTIPFGAYHFLHPSEDGLAQAEHFLAVIGKARGKLPAVMDWETTDREPANHDIAVAQAFLNEVERVTGRIPIIYASPKFLLALQLPSSFARYPLFIANYGEEPAVPRPWSGWTFWQQSKTGAVPGVQGHCDLDYFSGTIEQLQEGHW